MKKITFLTVFAVFFGITPFIQAYQQYCPFGTYVCPDPRLGGSSRPSSSLVSCLWKDELPLKHMPYAYTLPTSAQQVEYQTGQEAQSNATCYVYVTKQDLAEVQKFIGDFDRYSTISTLLSTRMNQAGGSNVGILPGESVEFRYMPAVLILQNLATILPGSVSSSYVDKETGKSYQVKEVSIVQALEELKKIESKINTNNS